MGWLQKVTLLLGGLLMLANFAYPPWNSWCFTYNGSTTVVRTTSRAFFLDPPQFSPSLTRMVNRWKDYEPRIDWGLLGVTAGAIVAGTAVAFGAATLFKKRPRS